jgi:hypothetical protein
MAPPLFLQDCNFPIKKPRSIGGYRRGQKTGLDWGHQTCVRKENKEHRA